MFFKTYTLIFEDRTGAMLEKKDIYAFSYQEAKQRAKREFAESCDNELYAIYLDGFGYIIDHETA